MTDIHSHILFGVDDGAKDINESIALLKQAVEMGYTDIVCSSHYYVGLYENKSYLSNFNQLKNQVEKLNLPIQIYVGNEFNLDLEYFLYKKNINKINNGRYFLVEIKLKITYLICKKFFKELLDNGIIPIFAHVERYNQITTEELVELSDMGVILQMNITSIFEMSDKLKYLLEHKYIDIVGTDVHKYEKRDYNLKKEFDLLQKMVGKEYFNLLTEINPKKVLNSEEIIKFK